AQRALQAGIPHERIWLDPGIGFGKTVQHNLQLLRGLPELAALGFPVLVGTSRKSFIGHILGGLPPEERLEGTLATLALAVAWGADIVRVHDVKAAVRTVTVADAICRGSSA
ncbi:MAG: dihydropteroate synthase, partial [Fimbriimonadales bacterium]